MPIYTGIALVLGLFGSTYAVFTAFSNVWGRRISELIEKGGESLEATKKNYPDAPLKPATGHLTKMQFWRCVWAWCDYLPTILFATLIYVGAIGCWLKWDEIMALYPAKDSSTDSHPTFAGLSGGARHTLGIYLVVCILCFVLKIIALLRLNSRDERFQECIELAARDNAISTVEKPATKTKRAPRKKAKK